MTIYAITTYVINIQGGNIETHEGWEIESGTRAHMCNSDAYRHMCVIGMPIDTNVSLRCV